MISTHYFYQLHIRTLTRSVSVSDNMCGFPHDTKPYQYCLPEDAHIHTSVTLCTGNILKHTIRRLPLGPTVG